MDGAISQARWVDHPRMCVCEGEQCVVEIWMRESANGVESDSDGALDAVDWMRMDEGRAVLDLQHSIKSSHRATNE